MDARGRPPRREAPLGLLAETELGEHLPHVLRRHAEAILVVPMLDDFWMMVCTSIM
jgi:hypothetical protein